MSAIFGLIRFDGAPARARELERMANTMAHRGPDGRKSTVDGRIGLGHCLLRVNVEDRFEVQPLIDRKADLMLVADCRIDNREELATTFGWPDADCRDKPDSQFILAAYKTWGEDAAAHLVGDFAFAIWDGRTQKLVLSRDHMGQRSVHYHKGEDFFVFATEVKALWAVPDVPRKLSERMLGKFLLLDLQHEDHETLFAGIGAVAGGATVVVDRAGRLVARRYWTPRPDPAHLDRDEDYYVAAYRRVLAEAVNCRIRRLIGPPALCLSAGYDSTAIAGLCGPLLTAQNRKLIAVSSVLPEDYRGPLRSPRKWVEMCRRDMPHLDVRYFVRGSETIDTNIDAALMADDGVPLLLHYVVEALFREAAKGGARLVMDGLLGDDTLNPRGGRALAYFLRSGQIRRFASEFAAHRRVSGEPLWKILKWRVLGPLAPLWMRRLVRAARRGFAPDWSQVPIAPGFVSTLIREGDIDRGRILSLPWISRGHLREPMQRLLDCWTILWRRNGANEAAMCGLDISRPFADKRVVELALAIPENLYVKDGCVRYLARRALADIYPSEFQTRKRSQDMLEPDYVGVLAASQPILRSQLERLAADPRLHEYFDFDTLSARLSGPHRGPTLASGPTFAWHAFRAAQFVAWFNAANDSVSDQYGNSPGRNDTERL